MLNITFQILFLGSPLLLAAIAHGLCIKYDWLHFFKRPIDMGFKFRGKRILGEHKTWRGMLLNVVFCTLGSNIQNILLNMDFIPQWLPLLNYNKSGSLVGMLLGLGMTVGELPNSFLKRQFNISPGKNKEGPLGVIFIIYDQVDLTVGIWVFIYCLVRPSLLFILWSFVLTLALHLFISSAGKILGMRKTFF